LQAYEHQDYPFARLLNQLNLPRDISRSPLINVLFNLERLNEAQVIDDLTVDMQQQPIAFTRMDLTFTANLKRDHVVLECDYNTNLFEASTIESLLKSYLSILETVVKDPQISQST
jgi:iturin family lipopeptide synthetase A